MLSKINNVVLYSKNFYVHSDNLIEDMFNMVRADHPETEINSVDELISIMKSDHKDWFLHHFSDKDYNLYSVPWETDQTASIIYAILIDYNSYIRIYGSGLKAPVYSDKPGFYPQLNLSSQFKNIFEGLKTVDEFNEAINNLFNMSKSEHLDNFINDLKMIVKHDDLDVYSNKKEVAFDYSLTKFNELTDKLKSESLNGEKACTVFMNGLQLTYKPYIMLDFDVFPVYFEFKCQNNENLFEIFKNAFNEVYKTLNKKDFYYEYRNINLSVSADKSFESLYDSIINEKNGTFKQVCQCSTGFVELYIDPFNGIIRFMMKDTNDLSDFVVEEHSLYNVNRNFCGIKK